MKQTLSLFILLLSINLLPAQTAVQPVGSGTESVPYQIATLNNLYWLSQADTSWTTGHYFIQTADIDATDTQNWNTGSGFSSIGTSSVSFNGSYDGQNHAISNLYINRPSDQGVGLFGVIDGAQISNLGLLNADIKGDSLVGGLAGACNGSDACNINNCYTAGLVNANNGTIGGLIGGVTGGIVVSISNSHSGCAVTADSGDDAGGLVGYISQSASSITDSYASGALNSNGNHTGGLAGQLFNTTLSNCYASGAITSSSNGTGGLIGNSVECTVTKSYASGAVSGGNNSGGLLGYTDHSGVSNCFATGAVDGSDKVGGLVGYMYKNDTITYCYSTGLVTGNTNTGGLAGYSFESTNDIIDCFWDTETSNQATSAGGTGKTTAQMKTQSTFTDAGWDFRLETANGTNDVWGINTLYNGGYPFLSFQGYPMVEVPSGTGTENAPYQIANLDNLYWLSQADTVWTAGHNFIQTADIDASDTKNWDSGKGFSPIGNFDASARFSGSYNGQDYTIDGLYINRTSVPGVGMFGNIDTATVKNLGLLNVDITGNYGVGGLVGTSQSTDSCNIINCYTSGSVSAGDNGAGGLVGVAYSNSKFRIISSHSSCAVFAENGNSGGLTGVIIRGKIIDSYATGTVDCNGIQTGGLVGYVTNGAVITGSFSSGQVTGSGNDTGGLVGILSSSGIRNCYAVGTVQGNEIVGGLAGYIASATISNCYAKGLVSGGNHTGGLIGENYGSNNTISNSFWDTETSTQNNSAGGTGKTTAEMTSLSTFIDAGWDFIGETVNGTEDYWNIGIAEVYNNGYPFLSWQSGINTTVPAGLGTSDSPYQIANLDNLQWLSATDSIWTAGHYFIQTENIDAGNTKNWDSGNGFSPIGIFSGGTKFKGSYDGQNHAIDSLYINRTSKNGVGLFGAVDSGAEIKNLGLTNLQVMGQDAVGGLVGYSEGDTVSISNCYTTGTVSGTNNKEGFGGLVGYVGGGTINISDCYSACSVTGNIYDAGGLAGIIYGNGSISNSHFSGTVTLSNIAGSNIGGLVGSVESPQNFIIIDSYSSGSVSTVVLSGNPAYTGGLVGSYSPASGSISNCYSTGSVNGGGGDNVGGLVGNNSRTIKNCYSTSQVSGNGTGVGGLVGQNSGTVINSFSTGQLSGSGTNVGGLVGYNFGTVSTSFWDTETSGQTTSNGGTGKTTAQMKTLSTYTGAGWDFQAETANGTNDYWNFDPTASYNNGYPYLYFQYGPATIYGNTGVGNATLSWADTTAKSTTSDSNGDYSITVSYNWTGIVTPFIPTTPLPHYPLTPANRSYTNLTASLAGEDYVLDIPVPSGSGTESIPYQIANLDNLYWLSQTDSVWTSGHYFIQTENINAGDTKNWDSNKGFSPIGILILQIIFTAYTTGKIIP